jgi:predicted site-specific integrase-resolvase
MENNNYVSGKKAIKILGVHVRTLYNWDKEGKIETIRTPGNKRLYNVKKYLENKNTNINEEKNEEKLNICYCRVSSLGQKDDLQRQIEYMKDRYPNYIIISDIASGINFKRKGLNKIIDLAIENKLKKLVIAYKDRLARFGYDLIERILNVHSNCEIIIENKTTDDNKPEEEIMQDVLTIFNVFNAKINGIRKYNKKKIKTNN